tara:strand:- start:219 stop:1403 length:1185 start_codon:yes stop_codon:yes gene_type:complete
MQKKLSASDIIIEVMRHFGYRKNYEVANYFNVTPQTLSGWIKSGEIPSKHLIKFNNEILPLTQKSILNNNYKNYDKESLVDYRFSYDKLKKIIKNEYKIILLIPSFILVISIIFLFFISKPVYTSTAKVLPVSEDGSNSSGVSSMAAQLGINFPLSIGGRIPWDEIYPEIVMSNELIINLLEKKFNTDKYGNNTLKNLLINEIKIKEEDPEIFETKLIQLLKEKIFVSRNRISPIISISVSSFEPKLSVDIARVIINESGLIQRRLKTNRVRQKRMFIEERMNQVYEILNTKEMELRKFRENNRSIKSASLQMQVQEMGREIDLQNSLYVTLKTQYEKAKIDEVENEDMVQLIDGPTFPIEMSKPKRLRGLLMSLLIGFFGASIIVYFRSIFKD